MSQQINSFNHFLGNTIQDVVDEIGKIVIKPERQFKPGEKRVAGRLQAESREPNLRIEV